ncbi:hypothetical protein SFUMM280S_00262 [Streptomyces fumanus]
MHWADQETLRWLAALAEHLRDLPVLVVIAYRPDDVTEDSARYLDAAVRATDARTATLSVLTPEATAGLTRATLGPGADAPFCREVVGRHRRQPLRHRRTPRQGPRQRPLDPSRPTPRSCAS